MENLAPEDLEVSEDLRSALVDWAAIYSNTLDRSDPLSSGFNTELERELFSLWGRALAGLLAQALQEPIDYFDDRQQLDVVVK